MIIRRARPADAASGAACHVACWREAYDGLVEPQRLAALTADVEAKAELWRTLISQGRPPLVAVDGDDVVGFIAAGANQEPGVAATFQVHALNVRRAYWGTGLAQHLFAEAAGDRDAYLWVLRDNARACAFYARNGFTPDGALQIDPDFGAPIIRMVRRTV